MKGRVTKLFVTPFVDMGSYTNCAARVMQVIKEETGILGRMVDSGAIKETVKDK